MAARQSVAGLSLARSGRGALTGEGDRSEVLQRLQVGAIGLIAVLLFVTIANVIVDNAADEESGLAKAQPEAVIDGIAEAATPPQEPLVELGVAPATPSEEPAKDAGRAPGDGRPNAARVPDLEPDPNLDERMDREPN
jgi:hypothetical protein